MTTLHTIYRFICRDVIARGVRMRSYLMEENQFFLRIFPSALINTYSKLLNPAHPDFDANSLRILADGDNKAQSQRLYLTSYFLANPASIEALQQNCNSFLSEYFSIINWENYLSVMQEWLRTIPAGPTDSPEFLSDSSLIRYLENACRSFTQYPVLMTWMILDAVSTNPQDIHTLYSVYYNWKNASSGLQIR